MARHPRKSRNAGIYQHPHADIVGLWCTRILLDLEAWKGLDGWNGNQFTSSGAILKAMGIGHLEDEDIGKREFIKILTQRQVRPLARSVLVKSNLPNNVHPLAQC